MKKVLGFILSVVMLMTCFGMLCANAEGETGTITGATLNLGSTLTIDYYATFTADADDVTMRFTSSSGRKTEVKGVYDNNYKQYKFSYTGINPQCMADTIDAELMYNDTVLDFKEDYSVKLYCQNQITKSADALGYTSIQLKAFRTLLADMLFYGARAQEYREYNLSDLADSENWVSYYTSDFSIPSGVREVTGNSDANNKVKSVALNMANVNRICFKLALTDDATVTLNGIAVDKATLIKDGDSYLLYSEDITAVNFDKIYTVKINVNGSNVSTVSYNINAYVQKMYNAENIADIVKALYNYGLSAKNFNKIVNGELDGDFDLGEEDTLESDEKGVNLIPALGSNFEGATVSKSGWKGLNSSVSNTMQIVQDQYGDCLKFNPAGVSYASAQLNLAPYINEAGRYIISFKYKVEGSDEANNAFAATIRAGGEASFTTKNSSNQDLCNFEQTGAIENGIWYTYETNFAVFDSDVAGGVKKGAPWNLCLHNMQAGISAIYIDDFKLVKENIEPVAVTEAETWVANELVLASDKWYDDCFNAADVDLTLTNGEVTYKIPGFWDGENVWRVRFVCPTSGVWTYTTECTDTTNAGLHNVTGAVVCTEYTGDLDIYKHGFVKTDSNKKYFTYADGTPFFYLGDTHWGLGTETIDMVKTISTLRAEQGYTVYQSEPIGAKFNLVDGFSANDISGFREMDEKFKIIADNGLVHANAQFIFPDKMSDLIKNNGGYSDTLLHSEIKYKTGDKNKGDNVDENGYLLDENGNKIKFTAELYEISDEVKAYLEKISRYWVARYSAYPVMWTLGQEVDRDFFWTQKNNPSHPDWGTANNPYHDVAEYMYKYDPYKHPLSAHQEGSSYTDAQNSTFRNIKGHTWYAAQWKPSLTTESLHTKAKIFNEYGQGKPVINYEPYYVYLQTKNFGGRAQAWMSFLSGFAGHAYGAQDTWCYTNSYVEDTKSNDGVDDITSEEKINATWQDALTYDASFQMLYMKAFLTGTVGQWYELIPRFDDTNYLVRDEGAYAVMASTADNGKIVVYFYNFSDNTIAQYPNSPAHGSATGTLKNLSANTEYNYMWFNPITNTKSYGSFTSTAQGTWDIPEKATQDMVLYVYNR